MSSPSLAARLLRGAACSSEVYALSRRCADSSATSRAPVSLARFHASAAAAAASPPSRITTRRFLASQSPAACSKIFPDENLRRLIGEIDCVVLSEEVSAQLIKAPKDFPFEIIDNPGDQAIVLKREFAGERVKAIIYTNFDTEEDVNNDDAENHVTHLSL